MCVHSPGSNALVSGSCDGTVRIWDLASGRTTRALFLPSAPGDGSTNAVTAVCQGSAGGEAGNWVYAAAGTHVYGFDLRDEKVEEGVQDRIVPYLDP